MAVYKDGEILTFKPAHKKSVSNVSFCPLVYRFVDLSVYLSILIHTATLLAMIRCYVSAPNILECTWISGQYVSFQKSKSIFFWKLLLFFFAFPLGNHPFLYTSKQWALYRV